MSRTYKYPRENLEESITRDEPEADLRIQKRLEQRKQQEKQKVKRERSFKKFISFRDKQRARI